MQCFRRHGFRNNIFPILSTLFDLWQIPCFRHGRNHFPIFTFRLLKHRLKMCLITNRFKIMRLHRSHPLDHTSIKQPTQRRSLPRRPLTSQRNMITCTRTSRFHQFHRILTFRFPCTTYLVPCTKIHINLVIQQTNRMFNQWVFVAQFRKVSHKFTKTPHVLPRTIRQVLFGFNIQKLRQHIQHV